ncbi:MAG: hypothetical protein D6706_03120 [Chloroflexi bacterium]|nr:MAG: hypothetical protein D6706_03120 [Chloroflexota bacterium]
MSYRRFHLAFAGVVLVVALFMTPVTWAWEAEQSTAITTAVSTQTEPTEPDTTESNLPPEINRILASLGIYILTMFTMALGTEIMVDVVKPAFGLKSKPTARDALKEFENLLPGSLASLGVSVEAQERLQGQIRDLKRVLKPIDQLEAWLEELREGELKTAVSHILQQLNILPADQSPETFIKQQLNQTAHKLGLTLGLETYVINFVVDKIDQSLRGITLTDVQERLQDSINNLRAELITAWIREQLSHLETNTRTNLERQFNQVLRPQLANLGFRPADERALTEWFTNLLDSVEQYGGQQIDIYLKSLNELLIGVERQRYLLQSPARRAWRRICETDNWLGKLFRQVEAGWNQLTGRTKQTLDDFANMELIHDITEAGRVILELDRQHKADARTRVALLRLLSVIVATGLAYSLQIDSADLLAGLLPEPTTTFLSTVLIGEGTRVFGVTFARNLTAGIILTGLAASAGSGFWHDRLNQLQAVRKTAETAAAAIKDLSK